MGVFGLVPFLRKKSPHVLKIVPSRFKELQGKVVVFDGTLITQRLHFAPIPHEYRHILGWYRMIQELHENNVRAICVFDGKERSPAKQREALKRLKQQKLTRARGTMEMERLSRLARLTPLITSYESLPEGEKAEVAASLRNVTKDLPVDQHPTDEETFELETDEPDAPSDYSGGSADTSSTTDCSPLPVTTGDSVGPALTKDLPADQHPVDKETFELETNESDAPPDYLRGPAEILSTTGVPPPSVTGSDSVGSALDGVTSDLISPSIPTELTDGPPPSVTGGDSIGPAFTKDLPVDQHPVDEIFELETDEPDVPPDDLRGPADTSSTTDIPPPSVTGGDSVGPALDGVTSDLRSQTIATEPADPGPSPTQTTGPPPMRTMGPPPTQTTVGQAEEPAVLSSTRVSYMLAALYAGFLASIRPMGALLSPRTVLPRLEEQDDETEVTQELSQAQRRLVTEEEGIWKQLSEVTSKEGTEGDVSCLARELEDKSAKILTSYERRNNPPTNEVYHQSRSILEAMGVPCVNAKGGIEGEALAAAIVRDGLGDYVASEDTDVLVYGVPLLRNVTSGTEPLTIIEGREVRDALDMDSSQFLDFALLLGTDFTDRIRNVGPVRALKFILCHGSIEKIIEEEPKYTPKHTISDYLERVQVARAVFQLRPALPAPRLLEVRRPNDRRVLEVLQKFRLQRFAEKDADFSSLLGGNYFSDQP